MTTAIKTSDVTKNSIDTSSKVIKSNSSSKSELSKVDNNKITPKTEDFKEVLNSKTKSIGQDTKEETKNVDSVSKNESSKEVKNTNKIDKLKENLKKLEGDSKSDSKDEVNDILTELLSLLANLSVKEDVKSNVEVNSDNLINMTSVSNGDEAPKNERNNILSDFMKLASKLGIKEEDIKPNGEVNSGIIQTMIEGINGEVTSNNNLSSVMGKIVQLLKMDPVKDGLDTSALKIIEKLSSDLSSNLANDNTEAKEYIKSDIKDLMSEISNKQNEGGKVLNLQDMANKSYFQYNKQSSTENESNNITTSKEDKFLSSLIKDDKGGSLNKINLFASRVQAISNQGADTVSGINEITMKPIQEDVVTKVSANDTELMNLLNKLGIKAEDIKSNGTVNSDILKTVIEKINVDLTSNSNLNSSIEKIGQLLQTDLVKESLDTDSSQSMQKLLSNLSANIADDNTKITKSGMKNLSSEISNVLDNKQNQTEKVLNIEDLLNKNYSQDNKENSTGNETNNAKVSKQEKEVSKEDKSLNSIINDDKDSYLNKMNLFTSRTQTIQNQSVDTARGLTINKATFTDDLIKDVKFISNNGLKELTVKVNPGNLGEITIKLVQEDGILKANLKANSKETSELLSQNLTDIKKQLGDQNIKIAHVNVELYQGDTTFFKERGFGGQFAGEQERSNNRNSNTENNAMISEEEAIDNIATHNSNLEFFA